MITIPRSEYEQMKQQILELTSLASCLEEEISLLKNPRNSRTGSTAPSQDISRSNSNSLRTPIGRRSGGQTGHPGSFLPMQEEVDQVIDHRSSECSGCGCSLQGVGSRLEVRRQEIELPPVKAQCIEHRQWRTVCPDCGLVNTGVFPEHLKAPVQYGHRAKALVGYLSVFQYLPYQRLTVLLRNVLGMEMSQGCADNILEDLSQKSTPAYEAIRAKVQQSDVVGSDETGCRVNGKKWWFHVWQTVRFTFIVSHASRGFRVVEEYFSDGFPVSVYVSDCWAAQLKTSARHHQLCIAHLLRELCNFQKNLSCTWSTSMKALLCEALQLHQQLKDQPSGSLSGDIDSGYL